MRPLTLHASALTDSEYDLYTNALLDLAGEDVVSHPSDDSYYASLSVSAREARAWIRGRYTASSTSASALTPNQVDAVLKLFCPNLAPADTMSGGQLFAAMRLVTHLRHGKPLDGSLVFVQAHPDDASSPPVGNSSPPLPLKSTLLPSAPFTESPSHSRKPSRETLSTDGPSASTSKAPPPAVPPKPLTLPPLPQTPSSSTNPFINRSKSHDVGSSQPTPPALRAKPQPFQLQQQPAVIPPLPPRKSTVTVEKDRPPPPPPRHSFTTANSANLTPGPSSPFAFWHNVSTPGGTPTNPNALMQQSLQAGRIAQSLKRAEERLEQERVMEVLKSSSDKDKDRWTDKEKRTRSESPTKGVAGLTLGSRSYSISSGSSGSSAPSAGLVRARTVIPAKGPALPPRRKISPPLSAASTTWSGRSGRSEGGRSAGSFMEVANASVPSPRSSSSRERPPPQHPALVPQPQPALPPPPPPSSYPAQSGPPPAHPGRKPPPPLPSSATSSVFADGPEPDVTPSPTSRVFRSKSLHQPVSPASSISAGPPIPPRPRRRPESVQYGGASSGLPSARDGYFDQDSSRAPSPTPTDRTSKSVGHANATSSPASLSMRGAHTSPGVSRHLSLSVRHSSPRTRRADSLSGKSEPMANLREPIVGLKDKLLGLQPKLDAARYKAEAGFSRRGFVNHRNGSLFREEGEERLVVDEVTGESLESVEGADGFGQDQPSVDRSGSDDDDVRRAGEKARSKSEGTGDRERFRRPWEVERDEMKWPVQPGEGWAPL